MAAVIFVLAGPPGAGKSSVLNKAFAENMPVLDLDQIVRDMEQRDISNVAHNATQWFEQAIGHFISQKLSFGYETNFHANVLDADGILARARREGYTMQLFYVGLQSPEDCRKRVQDRVARGGHYVPLRVIEERFYKALANLREHFCFFERVNIYDNAEDTTRLVLMAEKGRVTYRDEQMPPWVANALAGLV